MESAATCGAPSPDRRSAPGTTAIASRAPAGANGTSQWTPSALQMERSPAASSCATRVSQ